MRSEVLLPAPLGPMNPYSAPPGALRCGSRKTCLGPEGLIEADEFDGVGHQGSRPVHECADVSPSHGVWQRRRCDLPTVRTQPEPDAPTAYSKPSLNSSGPEHSSTWRGLNTTLKKALFGHGVTALRWISQAPAPSMPT
jgi:hypothetical protein